MGVVALGLPVLGAEVLIAEIFVGGADGALDIPEVARRNDMPAGSDSGFPAVLLHILAAADHLADVAHREGQMVEARRIVVKEKHLMMSGADGRPEKHAAAGVAVGEVESQPLAVKVLHRLQVGDIKDDVTNSHRFGAVVIDRALVDPVDVFRTVHRDDYRLHVDPPADTETEAQSHRIGHIERAVPVLGDFVILFEIGLERLQVIPGIDAPDQNPNGGALLEGRRQVLRRPREDLDAGFIGRFIDRVLRRALDLLKPEVRIELLRLLHALDAEDHAINTYNSHDSSPAMDDCRSRRTLAPAGGRPN